MLQACVVVNILSKKESGVKHKIAGLQFLCGCAIILQCAGVAEWQTRRIQNPLAAMSCGFKSHLRHEKPT